MSDSRSSNSGRVSGPRNEISQNGLVDPDLTPLFEALSHHHRRLVLLLLKEGCLETKADVKDHCECSIAELELALEHRHLPNLERSGYIKWDSDTGRITKGDRFDEVEAFLDFVKNNPEKRPSAEFS